MHRAGGVGCKARGGARNVKAKRTAKAVPEKAVVKLPKKKLPDWLVKRWAKRICRVFKRDREKNKIPLKDVVKLMGLSRPGVEKFEKCSKAGPLFTTILRASSTYLRRGFVIVISRKGAWIQRCGTMV
jgi:hypothetical protein